MEFTGLWDFIVDRSKAACMPVVQDRTELEYVFNLLKECKTYLEVGTAEGNSLYVLTNAMPIGSHATYIDWAEPHTKEKRDYVLGKLIDAGYKITPIHKNSNDYDTYRMVENKKYDAVLIDAGHDAINVAIDAIFYGQLAKKYVIFHDIQLPEVLRAFEWYCEQRKDKRSYKVINSETYGYGVVEL